MNFKKIHYWILSKKQIQENKNNNEQNYKAIIMNNTINRERLK